MCVVAAAARQTTQGMARLLEEVLVITVPPSHVGKVIGARGAVIQGLRQDTGATIDLQKDAVRQHAQLWPCLWHAASATAATTLAL